MRSLAWFVMQGPPQAALVAAALAILSLLFPPALLLSGDVSSIAAHYRVARSGNRYVLTPRIFELLESAKLDGQGE